MDLDALLARVPEGWSSVRYAGRRYGLTRTSRVDGREVSIYAEELGGNDVVSANVYRVRSGDLLKSCEMPDAKVLAFLRGWTPGDATPMMNAMMSAAPDWYFNVDAREWTSSGLTGDAAPFHRQLPGYQPTPLVSLPALAEELGVGRVLLKDESSRLGLPAFKVLGASWACARTVAQVTGADLDLPALQAATAGSGLRLVTATDGNHGRAVVWMARLLGIPATVFVPGVMSTEAERAIAAEGGADVIRLVADYDEAVRIAAAYCDAGADAPEDETRLLVQDTAWHGYEVVPSWIVDGYATLLEEIDAALDTAADLVVVPVGVGSLAQAVVAHYRHDPRHRPAILAAEPETAACLLTSLRAGRPTAVATSATTMAGLNCGTVSSAAWPVLSAGCDAAVALADDAADKAVVDLDALGVSSGPSGAATLAAARAALLGPGSAGRRAELRVGEDSTVVLLSTEGAHHG